MTTPKATAAMRENGTATLGLIIRENANYFTNAAYGGGVGIPESDAEQIYQDYRNALRHTRRSRADWYPEWYNSDTLCKASLTTDMGYINRARAIPDFDMAKQYYEETLSDIDPSFCNAASYLAELHVHMPQYDAAKAHAALHLACLLCGDKSIHLDDVRLAYAKRNIVDVPTCPSVVTKDVGDSMQVSYIVDDGGSADADASILVHASVPHMSWLGIGISDDGSMSGSGGSGSDMAICDSSGLKRFFVTYREPVNGTEQTVTKMRAQCLQTQPARLYFGGRLPRSEQIN